MPAPSIHYTSDGKLVIPPFECHCGCDHRGPAIDIYVGKNLLRKLPGAIRRRDLGTKCLLVADRNTYALAGRDAERILREAGFDVSACVVEREGDMEPDETAVGEVLLSMRMDTEFLISVGSGSVTDITRITAAHTERPFVCVGTAPSMDGYTSTVAPLLFRGLKINAPAVCPEIILCDIDILRTAPKEMFLSGVGDVLGKYIAKVDWQIGHIVNGEDCCPVCCALAIGAANRLLENIDEIAARTEKGTKLLIEALLLAGVTIMIIGNTRAVASVEHSLVHYWDMELIRMGKRPARHGTAVGVATLLVWPVFERFASLDPYSFSLEKAIAANPTREQRIAFMNEHYGERSAAVIMRENPEDFLTEEELSRRVLCVRERFDEIRKAIGKLPDRAAIESAIRTLGGPIAPGEISVDEELLRRSLACAKDYRSRYTLFKTIAELGMPLDDLMD